MISSVSKFLPLFESRARDRSVEFYLFEIRATRSRRRGGRDSRASRSAATPRPVARDGGHVCHPERPRLPAAAVAGEDPVGFGSPGGPGSRPRPPPARRLPGLSPGRGVRRGSRPRARGRPSQTSSQRSAPEYGRWVFAGRARWRWSTCWRQRGSARSRHGGRRAVRPRREPGLAPGRIGLAVRPPVSAARASWEDRNAGEG